MAKWQGGSVTQHSQLISYGVVGAVSAAAGFGLVYWHMRHLQPGGPSGSSSSHRKAPLAWYLAWPWFSRKSSQLLAAAPMAAERLAVLARSAEAIESAQRVPPEKRTSLAGLQCRASGDSSDNSPHAPDRTASLPRSDEPFGTADLQFLAVATRNGSQDSSRTGSQEAVCGHGDGQVYKALCGGTQPVSVREFCHAASAGERQKLRRLVEQLSRCKDRHIVKLLGCVPAPGRDDCMLIASPLRAMQRLESALAGPHAEEFLWYRRRSGSTQGKTRELGRGRDIALSVARALQWLHGHDILHLDLRASNVLLGKGTEVRLADAGLARFVGHDYMAAESTVGAQFTWTAPEVMHGLPPTPAADMWSFGVVLYQLLTGNNPVLDRRRKTRVPEECPQAVQDLLYQCLDRNPEARPTAAEVVGLLSTPLELLPRALRQRRGCHQPAGAPVQALGGKPVVWDYTQQWINSIYGSAEAAAASGYTPPPVDDILEVREWDQYKDMIDELRGHVADPQLRVPGSRAFARVLELHTAVSRLAKIKLACTAQQIREQRIAAMASLDSLLELAPGAVTDGEVPPRSRGPPAAHSSPAAPRSGDGSGGVRHGAPGVSAAAAAKVPEAEESLAMATATATMHAESVRQASGCSGASAGSQGSAGDVERRQTAVLAAMRLTPDQQELLLTERRTSNEALQELNAERRALVRALYDFAVGASHDQAAALEASGALRRNIMEEGRLLHSQHTWVITELLSPTQYATCEVVAFPTVADPPIIMQLLASAVEEQGSRDEGAAPWQPLTLFQPLTPEGDFSKMRWRASREHKRSAQ